MERTMNVDWRVWEQMSESVQEQCPVCWCECFKPEWAQTNFWMQRSSWVVLPWEIVMEGINVFKCCEKQPAQFFVFFVDVGNGFFEMAVDRIGLKYSVCVGNQWVNASCAFTCSSIDSAKRSASTCKAWRCSWTRIENQQSLCKLSWGCACPSQLWKSRPQISPWKIPPFVRWLEVQM